MKYLFLFIFLFFVSEITAQLCTGSLGNPVVNISFGNKNNPTGPLQPGITNLGYVANSCPNDGNYSIVSSALGCFTNTWHDITRDHTGDEEGKMMLINATNAPSVFYIETITGLCGNTTYEFGAWVANVLKPTSCGGNGTKPNLTFTIETSNGTVLETYSTGNINETSVLSFKQFGFLFKPPLNTNSVVLKITSNAGAGCGNDLAIDDITFRPCGPTMSAKIDGVNTFNKTVCFNEQNPMLLSMEVGQGYNNPVYQWQISNNAGISWNNLSNANQTNFNRTPTNVGNFQYRLLASESVYSGVVSCQTASLPITIQINSQAPQIGNQVINQCFGGAVNFAAASGSGSNLSYLWTGPNNFSSTEKNPQLAAVNRSDTGRYIVKVTTSNGCSSTDTVRVTAFNAINASFTGNTVICLGDSTLLTAIGGTTQDWYNNSRASIHSGSSLWVKPVDTTQYQVIIKNVQACTDTLNIPVQVIKPPQVDAGPDKTIMQGNSTALLGKIDGQYNGFTWQPLVNLMPPNSLTPLVSPFSTQQYTLTAYGMNGCTSESDTTLVRVLASINPPNSFSPNGDGIHDEWIIPGLETYPNGSVSVFNRYGQVVFQTKPYFRGWNGKLNGKEVPTGVYYFIINRGNGEPLLSGSLYLIR